MSSSRAERTYLELVRLHQSAILGFIWRRVGDRDLAEDLTQETFVKAWRALGRLELEDDAADRRRAWLYRIARNTVTDHMRRQARLSWLSLESVRLRSTSDPAGEAAEKEPVHRVLNGLEPEQREVLLLFNHLGFSAAEVGEVLGISAVAARKRRQRAKTAFELAWEALQEEDEPSDRSDARQSRNDRGTLADRKAPEDGPPAHEQQGRRPATRSEGSSRPDARTT